MSQFHYRAFDRQGQIVAGEIAAASQSEALHHLKAQGLMAFETTMGGALNPRWNWLQTEIGGTGLSLAQKAQFAKMLASLLQAGVALDRSLQLMMRSKSHRKLDGLAASALAGITAGQPLSAQLQQAQGFSSDEIGLIKSGEQTGHLAVVLAELATSLEKRLALRDKLTSALVYPVLLVIMAVASLVVIATVLVPNIAPIFAQAKTGMPWIVRAMTSVNDLVEQQGAALLAACVVAGLMLWLAGQTMVVKSFMEKFALRVTALRKLESARLCRTLATLLRNGVQLEKALRMTADAVRYGVTRAQLLAATERLIGGARLAASLDGVSVLDVTARQMIAIGEETNRLDMMLTYVADANEADSSRRLERAVTLLTPLITIALGLLIGGLIMSVMRAILSINDLALS
jgi:general secretion pathway protein F